VADEQLAALYCHYGYVERTEMLDVDFHTLNCCRACAANANIYIIHTGSL
jgi:hypothetical protein